MVTWSIVPIDLPLTRWQDESPAYGGWLHPRQPPRRARRESFISPETQRKKIADWAKLHEVEIVEWWEEIDQSGAKLERPIFQQALARCEAGETGGIVVAKLDRFARSAVDALGAIRRLNEAGARLVSVEDNSTAPPRWDGSQSGS
jgi:DNA invertase Pin-like site-specific DNA recombinase